MPPALEFDHVTFGYPGQRDDAGRPRLALDGVTLSVKQGERLGILGPNGGGKSTLLKLTLGLLREQKGSIRVFGQSPVGARRAGLIGYVPQRLEAELAFPITARQAVAMPAALRVAPWRGMSAEQTHAVEEAIALVGAESFAGARVGELSGGQLQRVMIARALASRPRLLLLDEPTVGIDPAGQQQFSRLLARLHETLGLTVVVVSHDIRTVALACDTIACLSRTLHSHVAPEGLTPQLLADVFRHDVAAIFGDVHVDAHDASTCKGHTHAPPKEPRA